MLIINVHTAQNIIALELNFSLVIQCPWSNFNIGSCLDCLNGSYNPCWVSYFSRSVIIIIDFPLNVISKKYFSWPLMRSLSFPHLCVPVNVCKQKSQEIPEVTCTRRTIIDFLHETPLIWVIGLGVKLCLVYFRSLHTCKNYLINAKYMINIYILNTKYLVV